MKRRRSTIPQRVPIFLGCEGESEQAYGQCLNDILRDAGNALHLEVGNLSPGAGDPLARLRRAEKEIEKRERHRTAFRHKAILMDDDQIAGDAQRRQKAERMALEIGITIIWQTPCHEAFLLRHLPVSAQFRPSSSDDALTVLRRVWPQYAKPMTTRALADHITPEAVRRAAGVEPALAAFLDKIGVRL